MKTSKVEIGTTTTDVDVTGIIFIAVRLVGSGPGGDFVSFRTTPNTVAPVGQIHYHKHWVIIISFDENMYTVLFDTDVEDGAGTGKAIVEDGENTAIMFFKISIVDNSGSTTTWRWSNNTTFVASYSPQITNDDERQPCEVKFISRGVRTVA